ncbi:MAG: MoaD/ThiS family protein [Promethearchaeota archaeon]
MPILIKLYGNLREKVKAPNTERGFPVTLNIKKNEIHSVFDILDKFIIKEDEISHIFVNGKYCGPGKKVKDGDRVGLFPRKMSLMFAEIPNLNSIYVTVTLSEGLKKYGIYGIPKSVIEIPEGSTIKSVLKKLKSSKLFKIPKIPKILEVPKEEKKLTFKVNGSPKYDANFIMEDNDSLSIFPPMTG